jgi:iron(III) transport system permease protein
VLTLLALVVIQVRVLGNREFVTITGKGYKPEVWRLGTVRWAFTAVIVLYALVALLLPAIQLLLGSFSTIFGLYSWDRLTLEHYRRVLESPVVRRALTNTLLLAVGGGFLAMLLTAGLAYVVARTRYGLRRALDLAAWIPWVLPGIVLGMAMLWAYAVVPGLKNLYGTPWLLLIAVVVTVIPVGVRLMAGSLVQLSTDLEESARVHGASWARTFRTVVLPLVRPSFFYGWLVVAIMITGELSVPLLLYSAGSELFSIVILIFQSNAQPEQAAALFSLVLLALAVAFGAARLAAWLLRRGLLRALIARLRNRESLLHPSLETR